MVAVALEKRCVICRADVAGKARVKRDTGEYLCGPCYERRRKRRARQLRAPLLRPAVIAIVAALLCALIGTRFVLSASGGGDGGSSSGD